MVHSPHATPGCVMRALLPTLPLILASLTFAQGVEDTKSKSKPSDRDLVTAAVRDYVEGVYDAEPDRIKKSVAPDLNKVGVRHGPKNTFRERPMTYDQLFKLAANYNKDGKRIPKDAPKKIEILGLLPKVATAKLTASWGIDLMQLIKTKDTWQIKHIVWQPHPKPVETTAKDRQAITVAAQAYATAFYTAKPELIDAHVDKKLAKFGNYFGREMAMTFEQLRDLATNLHKNRPAPKDSPKVVEILDCNDNTACVKLTGAWGLDFMNLIRTEKGWKIRQVIWQSHPPKKVEKIEKK